MNECIWCLVRWLLRKLLWMLLSLKKQLAYIEAARYFLVDSLLRCVPPWVLPLLWHSEVEFFHPPTRKMAIERHSNEKFLLVNSGANLSTPTSREEVVWRYTTIAAPLEAHIVNSKPSTKKQGNAKYFSCMTLKSAAFIARKKCLMVVTSHPICDILSDIQLVFDFARVVSDYIYAKLHPAFPNYFQIIRYSCIIIVLHS